MTTATENKVKITEIRDFFGMTTADFKAEWMQLSKEDKEELKELVAEHLASQQPE